MKSNNVAVGPRGLSRHVNVQDYRAILVDAATLKKNFMTLETFWKTEGAADGFVFAEGGIKALQELELSAQAKDGGGVEAAWTALLSSCAACHVARVRRLPDRTLAIAAGSIVPSPAKATIDDGRGTGTSVYESEPGNGIVLPRKLKDVRPDYTSAAMSMRIQGSVVIEIVVRPDGTVGDLRLLRSVDPVFGLDDEAIKAVKQWRFTAGTRLGVPVPVRMRAQVFFTLQ